MLIEGKVITVWSSRNNMGTTFTAINLAKELSKYMGKTILVDLNLIQPRISDYLELVDSNHTIDNLYPFAIGKNLNGEIIEANCEKVDELYVLKGTLNPSMTEFVNQKILTDIIQSLKENFTYVIIDVNSSLNNPGTFVALRERDVNYTLLHRDLISILSFNDIKPFLFGICDKSKFQVIFNNDSETVFLQKSEIVNTLDITDIGTLPLINNMFNFINKGEFKDISKKKESKKYFEELNKIIKSQISDIESRTKKKKFKFL